MDNQEYIDNALYELEKVNVDELQSLLNKGWSKRQIARHFNCSVSAIDKRIKRYIDIYQHKHLLKENE